jgi:hypothetical protein
VIFGLSNREFDCRSAGNMSPERHVDLSRTSFDPRAVRRICFVIMAIAACQGPPSTSTTAQEAVVLLPSTYDFGSLQVGSTSAPRTINVNPSAGNQYDLINSITEACPDFAVSAPGLPAEVYRVCEFGGGEPVAKADEVSSPTLAAAPCITTELQAYQFSTTFTPTIGGLTSCVVTLNMNNGASTRTVTLSGTGTIPLIAVAVTPASVPFGDVRRQTTSTAATINVRNNGSGSMSITSVSATAGFSIVSGPPSTTVGSGGVQAYGVVCQPPAVGPMNGSFTVNTNDPAKPSVNVPLSCNGIDSNLDISPSPAALPTTRVGEPTQSTIQLVNSGAASMTLQNVTLASPEITIVTAPNAGTVLNGGGGSAPVVVRYDAAAAGNPSGTLTITYDGGQMRTSQISARALDTSMAMTPDGDVDLGPVCIGQTKSQEFSVLANADASFVISSIAGVAAPFSLTSPNLPATVQGAGATTLKFTIGAAPTEPGTVMQQMTVTTDIPGSSPREINLSAIGLSAGVAGTPETLDLGSQPVDMTGIGQEITISNCTPAAANLANARIEGLDAASFAIVQQPTSATLAPNASAKWLVVMTPRSVGAKEATFSVDHEGGTTTVLITGEGLGDDVLGGGDGPPSYYACNAGNGGALFMLMFVIAFAIRRRR